MTYFATARGVKPVIVRSLRREVRPALDWIAVRRILRHLNEFQPHIVHTHTAKAGAVGRFAVRLYNLRRPRDAPRPKVVHTFHGHVLAGYFGPIQSALFRFAERRLARFTDAIVSVSPRVRNALLQTYKIGRPEQHVVIPLGFDLSDFARVTGHTGTFRRDLGIPDDTVLVTAVGRLTPIKNHQMLLAAAQRLADRAKKASIHFAIVGDGELRGALEHEARAMGIAERFTFAGWRRDMTDVYADSDIVVLCSRNEGTPVTLIEAMACGRPVVSTAVGGVPDVVSDGDTGLLVPSHREDKLAVAIGQLAEIPSERERIGANARAHALKTYNVDRLVADVTALYERLLDPAYGARRMSTMSVPPAEV